MFPQSSLVTMLERGVSGYVGGGREDHGCVWYGDMGLPSAPSNEGGE